MELPELNGIVLIGFLVMAVIGSVALGYARLRKRPWSSVARTGWIVAIALSLFGIVSSCTGILWDGGFAQTEFEISFRDADGNPVPGVELRVEDRQGRAFYYYPVTDFAPDQAPISDENGTMIFHHVRHSLEFGGHSWHLFFVIPMGDDTPRYVCRFLLNGRDIARIPYEQLSRDGTRNDEQKVTRCWKAPQSLISLAQKRPDESPDGAAARARAFFHVEDGGKINREAAIAHRVALDEAFFDYDASQNPKMGRERDEQFPVVRMTIVVR